MTTCRVINNKVHKHFCSTAMFIRVKNRKLFSWLFFVHTFFSNGNVIKVNSPIVRTYSIQIVSKILVPLKRKNMFLCCCLRNVIINCESLEPTTIKVYEKGGKKRNKISRKIKSFFSFLFRTLYNLRVGISGELVWHTDTLYMFLKRTKLFFLRRFYAVCIDQYIIKF